MHLSRGLPPTVFALALLLAGSFAPVAQSSPAAPSSVAASPVAVEARDEAFGLPVEVTVAGLDRPAAEAALTAALEAVHEAEALLEPDGTAAGGLGDLNAVAGREAIPVDPEILDVLTRAQSFCIWSNGVLGPLGGDLYQIWGLRRPVLSPPTPEALASALAGSGCAHLEVDPGAGTVRLDAGSRVDLWPFASGHAVDQAAQALAAAGAGNAFVRIGGVQRGMGPGPHGDGWPVEMPGVPGLDSPLEPVRLLDEALAVADHRDGPLTAGGETYPPYLDLRKGRPMDGVMAVLAASELAVEAQGLAAVMFVTGSRDGQLRLGSLDPRPSVLWLLGSGEGRPLLVEYRWSELRSARR